MLEYWRTEKQRLIVSLHGIRGILQSHVKDTELGRGRYRVEIPACLLDQIIYMATQLHPCRMACDRDGE